MKLVFFDLDHTLIDGDSNCLWLDHLVAAGWAGTDAVQQQTDEYARYLAGTLDIEAYLEFQLSLLAGQSVAAWKPRRDRFVTEVLLPRISATARHAVAAHHTAGDCLAIVTATHSFLSEGVGQLLNLDVLAPQAEIHNGIFTGRISGEICFAKRKIACMNQWLADSGRSLGDFSSTMFYSDSVNDLPLLESVNHPVAVNADARLAEIAKLRGWQCLEWKRDCSRPISITHTMQ